MRISSLFDWRRVVVLASSLGAWVGLCNVASASGPVERLVQVLLHPNDPNVLVVRYAVAAEGFLISRDGGKTFFATCSEAVTPDAPDSQKLKRITSQNIGSAAPTELDGDGHLWIGQTDGLWTDDGKGCTWTKQADLDKKWAASLRLDPKDAKSVFAIINISTGSGTELEATPELWRRDASGTWSSQGAIKPHVATQRAYGSDLLAAATSSGTRLYANMSSSVGAIVPGMSVPTANQTILVSDDGGKTWTEGPALPEDQADLVLLGVDPLDPDRLLAVVNHDGMPDQLLWSKDQGKSFELYTELPEVTGASFAPDGRVFVGDSGDGTGTDANGGVWTAAKLGDQLQKLGETSQIDCLQYDGQGQKLYACRRDKFGTIDLTSGAFSELVRMETVTGLNDCSSAGYDTAMVCQGQLNAGASWCCAGHYPFTGFCGQYDITEANGRPVMCGKTGREYDQSVGNGPPDAGTSAPADAGASEERDAGTSTTRRDAGSNAREDAGSSSSSRDVDAGDEPEKNTGGGDSGCAVRTRPSDERSLAGALASLGLALVVLGRALRRRRS